MGIPADVQDQQHRTSFTVPTRLTFDEEEKLPLYTEQGSSSSSSSSTHLTPPDPKSPPDEVRDFLVQLLISTRCLPLDHARRIAAKWSRGTGRELKSYPPAMYIDIFGVEDGWMVYKEVKLCFVEVVKKGYYHRIGRFMVLTGLLSFEALMFILVFLDIDLSVRVFAGIAAVFGALTVFVYVACNFFGDSEEAKIEAELREGLKARVTGGTAQ